MVLTDCCRKMAVIVKLNIQVYQHFWNQKSGYYSYRKVAAVETRPSVEVPLYFYLYSLSIV